MFDERERRASYDLMLLTEELSRSEAWRIHVELVRLDVSRQIHSQNREELLDALETLSLTDLLPNDLGKIAPPSIEAGTLLVLRLLHNYLASAVMLADHVYMFAEQMYSPEQRAAFLRECSTRWSGLPVYTFTRRLRVYALHLRIPLSIAQFEFTASGLETTVVLDGAELRSWDGWKGKGRTFLSELSDNVPLTEVVVPHERAVKDFFDWLERWHAENVFKHTAIELSDFERRREAIVDATHDSPIPESE